MTPLTFREQCKDGAQPASTTDQIAEWMAENGGSIGECAADLGLSYGRAYAAWRRIRDGLGPQAYFREHSSTAKRIEDGKTFGQWTVICQPYKVFGVGRMYRCRCSCGTERTISGGALRGGASTKCKECASAATGKKNRCYDGRAGVRAVIGSYIASAEIRNVAWSLTEDEVAEILSRPCYYCGTVGSNYRKKQHFRYNGIDRTDNARGYSRDNVVPCCAHCNRAKGVLSAEEFIGLAHAVARHHPRSALIGRAA